jgi:hypothetical protein
MVLRKAPKEIIIAPLSGLSPLRVKRATKANSMIARYSGGPKERAALDKGGAKNCKTKMPKVPATKDPMAETARAAPARPFRVIWYPSIQVMTEEASPGILTRIEVVDPPY